VHTVFIQHVFFGGAGSFKRVHTHTTTSWPLFISTCVGQHHQLKTGEFW